MNVEVIQAPTYLPHDTFLNEAELRIYLKSVRRRSEGPKLGQIDSKTNFGSVSVFVISRHHLITNKKNSARLQDLADVEQLELRDA